MKRDGASAEIEASDADALYKALMRAVLSRDLTAGTKLSEETVANTFRVSRSAVRAALNRLHSESLVEFVRNRGAFIATPSAKESEEVFDLRIVIEKEIVARLATSIQPQQLRELEALVKDHREIYRAGDDARSMQLAEEFHLTLARMGGNGVLEGLLAQLVARTALILSLHSRRRATECGIDEHVTILEALRKKDGPAASQAMAGHLGHLVARVRQTGEAAEPPGLQDILARYAPRQ